MLLKYHFLKKLLWNCIVKVHLFPLNRGLQEARALFQILPLWEGIFTGEEFLVMSCLFAQLLHACSVLLLYSSFCKTSWGISFGFQTRLEGQPCRPLEVSTVVGPVGAWGLR